MVTTLCIYHGNCADGFGAAWVVRQFFLHAEAPVEFHAGVYQDPPPDVSGRPVIIVDFSYKKSVLEHMARQAAGILVLDHHKSAAEDLAEFPDPPADLNGLRGWMPDSGIYTQFDMKRSGAGMAWDYFHGTPRPPLIDHIEDRDLWRFKLAGTREIQAAVFSYPYDMELWDRLMDPDSLSTLRNEGAAIERKHHKDVAELVEVCKRKVRIGGRVVYAASLPYTLTSDAGHLMCEPEDEGLHGVFVPPFAACYWDTPDGRVFSLRSRDGGEDVSAIAKKYGGGGHEHAAGFRVSLAEAETFEIGFAG